jgi:hypothetical protein
MSIRENEFDFSKNKKNRISFLKRIFSSSIFNFNKKRLTLSDILQKALLVFLMMMVVTYIILCIYIGIEYILNYDTLHKYWLDPYSYRNLPLTP